LLGKGEQEEDEDDIVAEEQEPTVEEQVRVYMPSKKGGGSNKRMGRILFLKKDGSVFGMGLLSNLTRQAPLVAYWHENVTFAVVNDAKAMIPKASMKPPILQRKSSLSKWLGLSLNLFYM
jgi:hypothetical protein